MHLSTLVHDKELIIFCDESVSKGEFFSNFYGGVVVGSSSYQAITQELQETRNSLGIRSEVKWSKVSEPRLEPYTELLRRFFEFVVQDRLKVRVMFTQNAHEPMGLTQDHRENTYFILYYQFIKHAFNLLDAPRDSRVRRLRLYFDQFPDTKAKVAQFREYLLALHRNREFGTASFTLAREDIAEVKSHDHIILQCLDVVLGSMAFRLNEMHRRTEPSTGRRGSRTVAKEKLYQFIREQICQIKPRFNAGVSTGITDPYQTRWELPYAHWRFVPKQHRFAGERTKKGKKRGPT